MKNTLLTLITFSLVLVNLVLNVIIVVTVLPAVNNMNSLVTRIGTAIDLDIQSGGDASGGAEITMDSVTPVLLQGDITANLKDSGDGENHVISISGVTILLNNNSSVFDTYSDLTQYESIIAAEIQKIVAGYTYEEIKNQETVVEAQERITENLNTMFGSDLITKVTFKAISS